MPRLWNDTIETHRAAVRDATLDATASLVAEFGLTNVSMSQIAEKTGIGRATLYKYFPDVGAILQAWHERQLSTHLHQLAEVRDRAGTAGERLSAVLEAYASLSREQDDAGLSGILHQGEHVRRTRAHLRDFITEMISEGAQAGTLRSDIAADELADYCLHALVAARDMPSKAAVRRLVRVTMDGLRPSGQPG